MALHTQHDVHMEDTHEHDDVTMHANVLSADDSMVDDSQHGLVGVVDFNFLGIYTLTLEKRFY